jgi:hypothetical protein
MCYWGSISHRRIFAILGGTGYLGDDMTGMEPFIAAGAAAAAGALSPLAGKAAEKASEKLGEIFMQFALDQGEKKISWRVWQVGG